MTEQNWTDLIAVADLNAGWVTRADLGQRAFAVYDTPTGVYITKALCNHGGADLCDGYFDGHLIECPLHQGAFDVRDGRPLDMPATRPMKTYPARAADGMVQLALAPPKTG